MKPLRGKNKNLAVTIAGTAALMGYSGDGLTQFDLNWTADANPTFSGTTIIHGTSPIPGHTPFIYERVVDANNVSYYHMVIGDTADGFAQEVYIQVGAIRMGQGFGAIGPLGSASGGGNQFTNAIDPLGESSALTGNATGNPQRVMMRQLVQDDGLTVDFVKNSLAEKPSIFTELNADNLIASFIIDATGLLYDDMDTAAVVTNTMQITDPDMPEESATFDMAIDAPNAAVNAGRFIYTPGTGSGESGGTYTYFSGSVNMNPDWSSFFDHTQDNPWSYTENRPTPP